MGLAFKENCPDIRNTRVVDILSELCEYNIKADVYDPWVSGEEAKHEYNLTPVVEPEKGAYDAIIIAVAHQQFREMGVDGIRALGKSNHLLYDLKYLFPSDASDLRL